MNFHATVAFDASFGAELNALSSGVQYSFVSQLIKALIKKNREIQMLRMSLVVRKILKLRKMDSFVWETKKHGDGQKVIL